MLKFWRRKSLALVEPTARLLPQPPLLHGDGGLLSAVVGGEEDATAGSLPVVAGSSIRQVVEVQGAAVVVGEGRAWRRWEEREREKGGGGEEERQKGEGWQ